MKKKSNAYIHYQSHELFMIIEVMYIHTEILCLIYIDRLIKIYEEFPFQIKIKNRESEYERKSVKKKECFRICF